MKTINYKAQPWIDFREELKDKDVRSFSLGYDGKLYVLSTYKKDDIQWRTDNGMFPIRQTDTRKNYTVFVATSQTIETYIIPEQTGIITLCNLYLMKNCCWSVLVHEHGKIACCMKMQIFFLITEI
jgi:hypothetical protein